MQGQSLGHRAPLLWLFLPFATGLVIARATETGSHPAVLPWLATALLFAGGAVVFRNCEGTVARGLWGAGFFAALILAGFGYYHLRRERIPDWLQLPPREATLTLRITQLFPGGGPFAKASGIATITDTDPHLAELRGQRLQFSLALPKGQPAAPVLRGAEWTAVGIIEVIPVNPPQGTFLRYLADTGINFKFSRGLLMKETQPVSAYRRFCARTAERFEKILAQGLSNQPELVGISRAMMLGEKSELNDEQKRLFMQSGTMHLFAISGMHITVISLALYSLLSLLRVPRPLAAATAVALIWLYVDITGTSPSAVRAFLMVALVTAAFVLKRPGNPVAAITASACIVLLIDPMQLFGASFQMSYAIVFVLLLHGLPLGEYLTRRLELFKHLPKVSWGWHRHAIDWCWRWILSAIALGIATLPVSLVSGITFFGLCVPGAIIANLVLIPLSTLVLLAGFFSLLAGLVHFHAASSLFNHASALVLWVMDWLIRIGTQMPGMSFATAWRAPWLGPLALALLVALCMAGYGARWEARWSRHWMPLAALAILLLCGASL